VNAQGDIQADKRTIVREMWLEDHDVEPNSQLLQERSSEILRENIAPIAQALSSYCELNKKL